MKMHSQTLVIMLAAGSSSRLGRPKQLLRIDNKSLIRHSAIQASGTGYPVLIVAGPLLEEIRQELQGLPVALIENKQWEEGMASSIRCGVKYAADHQFARIIIMVCDQPFVTSQHLLRLEEKFHATGEDMIVSSYAATIGVPCLFTKKVYPLLLTLKGEEGARKIIKKLAGKEVHVPLDKGGEDIDTPEDYRKVLNLLS